MSRTFALVRSLVIGTLFISIWVYWLPAAFARAEKVPFAVENRWAWPIFAIGFAIGYWCIIEFGMRGFGTPAPFDPPRRLVVSGLYRWVRNPMYVGLFVMLIGETLLMPKIWREMAGMFAFVFVVATLMVVLLEEPALRRMFGADYEEYCRHVPRWIPRLTPFDKAESAA